MVKVIERPSMEVDSLGKELWIIGKPVVQVDAVERVSGAAQFVADITLPGMLWGKVLRSPLPHARIAHIDVSRALRLPGVKAVVTAEDTPKTRFGPMVPDNTILAVDRVRFVGEEVAAVAAVDEDTAEEALELIRVDYEELPAVFDPLVALEPGSPQLHEHASNNVAHRFYVERGDVEGALREAEYVFEERFVTSQAYHSYLEPMACIASWDLRGRVTMYLSTQVPHLARLTYAKALGLPPGRVRIIKPYVGGGFGAKLEHPLHLVCAVLAQKAGRPVKIVNSREEDFMAANPRVQLVIDLKLGFKRDGTIVAKVVRVVGRNGGRTHYAPAVVSTACYRIDALYHFGSVKEEGLTVYTNTVPTSAFRGFGNPQSTFAVESALDVAAEALGLDPITIRLKNAVRSGDITIHGWRVQSCGLEECIRRATALAGWSEKKKSKKPYHGIGLACCNHVSGNRGVFAAYDGASAVVHVNAQGQATLYAAEGDMGQGQNTVLAQIVSEETGIPINDIKVAFVDTDISPFGLGSYASRSSLMGGRAVHAAAIEVRRQLLGAAAELLGCREEELDLRGGRAVLRDDPERYISVQEIAEYLVFQKGHGEPIIGRGSFSPDTVPPDPHTKYGNISPAYPFACHVAEVEVDPETGQVTVLSYVAAQDVGRILNLTTAEGQVHGGVAMGIGTTLMERMIEENGKILNPNFLDYRVPGPLDLPRIQALFVESVDPAGPYGAKGLGEPALNPVHAAIGNAISDAIGVRFTKIPITPEVILEALHAKASASRI